jgi:glycosyltransferase involved in cell wall biosynthesis
MEKAFAVIPALNEEKTIEDVIKRSKRYVGVIVVDDGSTDGTAKLAKKSGAILVKHSRNKGYGASLIDGINEAKRRSADFIVTLDADGQHNPDDIPRLLDGLKNGYDIVSGSRFISGKSWGTWRRAIAIKMLTYEAYILSGLRLTDIQSGFRAYRASLFDNITLKNSGMGMSVELPIKAKKLGYTFTEVPIKIRRPFRIKSLWCVVKQGLEVGVSIIKFSLFN